MSSEEKSLRVRLIILKAKDRSKISEGMEGRR